MILYFILLSLIYFFNVLSRMLFPLLLPKAMEEYLLYPSMIGTFYLLLALGFGFSLFFAQFFSARIGYQKVIAISAFFSGLLLFFFPFIKGFYGLSFFFLSFGLFAGLFLPSAVVLLSFIVSGAKLGRAIGTFSSFQTAAMIFAPLLAGWVDTTIFYKVGALLAMVGFAFAFLTRSHLQKGDVPSFAYFKEAIRSKANQTLFIFHSLAMGLNVGIYMIAPSYFIGEHAVSGSTFFPILSFSRALGIFASILSGILVDVKGLRFSLSTILILCGGATILLGFLHPADAVFLFCLQGPLAVALTTLVYVAISKTAPSEKKAMLVSLFASTSFLMGAGAIPQVMGILGDWNLYPIGFMALGFSSLFMGTLFAYKDLLSKNPEAIS